MAAKDSPAEAEVSPVVPSKYAKGVLRPFKIVTPGSELAERRRITKRDKFYLLIVVATAFIVRLYKIQDPDSVVFDEVHFGGFASKYIKGTFFMDVHPPLTKMLYAAIAWLNGFDGEFDFARIGKSYAGQEVPYVAMRMFPALCGIMTVILCYLTLKASGCRSLTAFLAAMLLIVENSLVTMSRLILLDSPLLYFIALTVYGFKKFEIQVPFTFSWFKYLLITGIGLGLALSSKWVGLFTLAWVGLATLFQLWFLFGDLTVSNRKLVGHVVYRAVVLLALPVALYLGFFAFHFAALYKTGDGSGFMSPEFKTTLEGSGMIEETPAQIYYGSEVTIRHYSTRGGYLHSHNALYETGSKQQQITLYPHTDSNNVWIVENVTYSPLEELQGPNLVPVKSGSLIRLRHKNTERRLHSHDHRPPVSEKDYQNEASCYGFRGFEGDANDNFLVEIVPEYSDKGEAVNSLMAIDSKFKLIHMLTGCQMFSHDVKLPEWGFGQQEVTCSKAGKLPMTIWYIESNSHPNMPEDAEYTTYDKPSFLQKVWELHKVMWKINSDLTDTHHWESRPESWPFMFRGINYWVKDHKQIYLMGNAPIWWAIAAIIPVYGLFKGIQVLRWQVGKYTENGADANVVNYDYQSLLYLAGWALHYFPSFLMKRQLFLHHYVPAYYFGLLGLSQLLDLIIAKILHNRVLATVFYTAIFFVASTFFIWYAPLIYSLPWTRSLCLQSKHLNWDFDCNNFYPFYDNYTYDAVKSPLEEMVEESLISDVNNVAPTVYSEPLNEAEEPVAPVDPEVELKESEDAQPVEEAEAVPEVESEEPVVEAVDAAEVPVAEESVAGSGVDSGTEEDAGKEAEEVVENVGEVGASEVESVDSESSTSSAVSSETKTKSRKLRKKGTGTATVMKRRTVYKTRSMEDESNLGVSALKEEVRYRDEYGNEIPAEIALQMMANPKYQVGESVETVLESEVHTSEEIVVEEVPEAELDIDMAASVEAVDAEPSEKADL